MACEKCWAEANERTLRNGKSPYDNYLALLKEHANDEHQAFRAAAPRTEVSE